MISCGWKARRPKAFLSDVGIRKWKRKSFVIAGKCSPVKVWD